MLSWSSTAMLVREPWMSSWSPVLNGTRLSLR